MKADRKTMQQEMANYAWNCVIQAKTTNGNNFSEYVSLLQGAGATILSIGLGQTIAFYYSQGKYPFEIVLSQWATFLGYENADKLIEEMMKDSASYRYNQTRILALLEWMKRFSKGQE
jgi:CRISPR/Cas system CMR-associated protein Cmr5 small subunit